MAGIPVPSITGGDAMAAGGTSSNLARLNVKIGDPMLWWGVAGLTLIGLMIWAKKKSQ